jgi:hypothetical protein
MTEKLVRNKHSTNKYSGLNYSPKRLITFAPDQLPKVPRICSLHFKKEEIRNAGFRLFRFIIVISDSIFHYKMIKKFDVY